ncbi:YncE family protein [Alcaligenes sp. SDU_A2]|uniref:YncE family protein n=1 Tax=Alcaligenes sp. SDU_A2 TaxID=3136634 RepID=UPI0031203385
MTLKIRLMYILPVALALSACGQKPAPVPEAASRQESAPTQQAIQRVSPAPALYELAWSAKQDALFVVSAGSESQASKVMRLDPATLAVLADIPLERKGFGLALDDAADRLYVGNGLDASITVIDTSSNRVIATIQLAQKIEALDKDGKPEQRYAHSLRELVLDSRNNRLYAPGAWFTDSALYVVDTQKLALERVVPGFGFLATGVTLDAPAGKLYVSNLQGQLYRVDTASLGIESVTRTAGDQLLNLELDKEQGRILATDQGEPLLDSMRKEQGGVDTPPNGQGHRVLVMDAVSGDLLHSLPAGKGPIALKLDAERSRLYVTSRQSGTVQVYDSRSYEPLQTVSLPAHPNSLALNTRSGDVYVSVKNGREQKDHAESVARLRF